MIYVTTGSRLHFGLFHLPSDRLESWPDRMGEPILPSRQFGGVGLMIDDPGLQLTAAPASTWSAEGPLAERALAFAKHYAELAGEMSAPCHIALQRAAPEHAGFGTGTQLGLAVARALAETSKSSIPDVAILAQRVGRGQRSALGVHGFAQGGFLVEAGQRQPDVISPLVARVAFPEGWRIVVVLTRGTSGLHGASEKQAFARLTTPTMATTDALCRLVLLGMLPALIERDIRAFSEALFDFNARVGEAFAPVQGGTYANSRIAEGVRFIRDRGVHGTGQSSWGPAVFAIVADEDQANILARRLQQRFNLEADDLVVTCARNRGAEIVHGAANL
jgi:beta-RFAP synthase